MLRVPLPCVPPRGHGVMLHMVQTPPPRASQPGKGHPKENPTVRDRPGKEGCVDARRRSWGTRRWAQDPTALLGFVPHHQRAQHPLQHPPHQTPPQIPRHHPGTSVTPQGLCCHLGGCSPGAAGPETSAQPFSHLEPAPCAKAELNWKNTHNDLLWNVV